MHRYVTGTLLLVVLVAGGGCAARRAPQPQAVASTGFELIHPPDSPDTHYPGGVRVRWDAPLDAWHRDAVFATQEECESSRIARIDDTIDKARAEVGDQAKFQLPVRQAVNARCVTVR